MKPSFIERLGAYFIDIIIVSIIVTLVCYKLPQNNKEIEEKLTEITEKLTSETENTDEIMKEYSNLMYDYQKDTIISSIVNVSLTIAYFIFFQYLNNGQTLGKKLLKLRVVDKNTEKPVNILKGTIRSLLTLSILSGVLNIILIYTTNAKIYFPIFTIVASVEFIFIFITVIFMIYKKDGRGLHDIMANTKVIKEGV